jgi:hypothetical protein
MIHLQKEVTTNHGVTATAWRAEDMQFNDIHGTDFYYVKGNLKLYLNEAAMDAKKEILDNCSFQFNDLTENEINNNTLSAVYARLNTAKLNCNIGEIDFSDAVISGI